MKKIALFAIVTMSTANAFNQNNYPVYMSQGKYTNNFSELPMSSELSVDKLPWASSFWPDIYGGIAFRWNDYHKNIPSFAQEHYKINDINEQIEESKIELFTKEHSSYETLSLIQKITDLKAEKNRVKFAKKGKHSVLFNYARPRRLKDVQNMSTEAIYKLSPAEKYDVYKMLIGESRKFFLTGRILEKRTGPFKEYWEGICHGWSSAALEFKEPKPVTINKKGVKLTFNSSDLKALLSQYHAQITRRPDRAVVTNQYGLRCDTEIPVETWELNNGNELYKLLQNNQIVKAPVPYTCNNDVDAGGFHLVLANQIGLLEEGFVVEATRDREVWNQPVFGYESKVLEEGATLFSKRNTGTAKQIKVQTIMKYANDGGRMYWKKDAGDDEFYAWAQRTNGTDNYRYASKTYEYILDLDRSGNILGGHWLSYERPDFIWIKRNKGFKKNISRMARYMKSLQNLVEIR